MTPAEVEAKLRAWLTVQHGPVCPTFTVNGLMIQAADALSAQAVELERMREALEPFALASATLSSRWEDHETHWQDALPFGISAGQLRAARQALQAGGKR